MNDKKITAMDVANLIIVYANQIKTRTGALTPIKLQKILYYVYVDCLVNHKTKLFDTPIEKWKFGPVVSSVYHNLKNYGVRHIAEPTCSYIFDDSEGTIEFKEIPFDPTSIELSTEIKNSIQHKVAELINMDPFVLVELTHKEKPWKEYESLILEGHKGLIYSDEELIEAFS
jgi:uncharacterized phage-associated protein